MSGILHEPDDRPKCVVSSEGWYLLLGTRHGKAHMRKASYVASILVGALLIVAGITTWFVVSTTLSDQKITVAQDASCLAGDTVDGPFSAYCEARVIEKHALSATGGKYYSELDSDDPLRAHCVPLQQMPPICRPRCSRRSLHLEWQAWRS